MQTTLGIRLSTTRISHSRGKTATLGLATLAALGLAARPAAAQVVTFSPTVTTVTSPSGAETLLLSGFVGNPTATPFALDGFSALAPARDAAGDTLGIRINFGNFLEHSTFDDAVYAPYSVTPVTFIQADLTAGQPVGLYDTAFGAGPEALTLGFSNGVTTTTSFAINVVAAPAVPEVSTLPLVLLGLGVLGPVGLGLKARRRRSVA